MSIFNRVERAKLVQSVIVIFVAPGTYVVLANLFKLYFAYIGCSATREP